MFLKNGIYSIVSTLINFLAPLAVLPVLTNFLSPDSLGNILYHETVGRYLSMFLLLGIPIYGVRELARLNTKSKELQSGFILSMISIQLGIALILILVWLVFFDINKYNSLTIVLALSMSLSLEWVFHGLEKFKNLAIRNVALKAVYVLLIFYLVKSEEDAMIYFGIIVLHNVLLMLWNIFTLSGIIRDFKWSKIQLKNHLKPIGILFSTIIVISIYTMLDVLLLKELSTDSEVAVYNIGFRIPKAAVLVVSSFLIVVIPRLNSYFGTDLPMFYKSLNTSLGIILFIGLPMSFFLAINSEWILGILVSSQAYSDSLVIFRILSLLPLIIGLSNFMGIQVLTTYGFENELFVGAMCGALVSIVMNLILIPRFGAIGAALSNLSAEICVVIWLALSAWRKGLLNRLVLNLGYKEILIGLFNLLLFVILIRYPMQVNLVIISNIFLFSSFFILRNKYRELYANLSNV